ncbi:22226_t:CDS:2 [Dentiscutata erythropus]|uniref:22226_t:CDS:1 n=1 Tax=Dentiscutata erythropus TaxID=1348616 RepID=A0A9N9H995_9GLOM|nr:22226_t:CDS:2 [Dentiscutata erythropus]
MNYVEAINLLMAVDELLLHDVTDKIIIYISQKLEKFITNDAIGVLQLVFQYEICEPFREPCLHLICIYPYKLFEHREFTQLDKSILMLILQRDDLGRLSEINIWKYLVKWGIGQNSILQGRKVETWNNDDYVILKNAINDFIPLIQAAKELGLGKIVDYLLARANFTKIVLSKLNDTEVLQLITKITELNFSINLQYRSDFKSVLERLDIDEVLHLMKTNNRTEIRKFFDNILSSTDSINPFLRKLNSDKILQLLIAANEFQYKKTVNNLLINARIILGKLDKDEVFQLMMAAKVLKHNIITDRLFLSEGFTGIILDSLNCAEILDLLVIANQMQLHKFFNHMLNFIDQKLKEYMQVDIFSVVQIIFNNDAFKSLHDQCLHLICTNPNLLFEHRRFTRLDKSILILTIHDCIPLIRWYQMPLHDFMRNIEFLKNIISTEPILNYLRYNMMPPQETTILPRRYILPNHMFLVRPQHFDIIASWIDKKDLKNNSPINNEKIIRDKISNESLYYESNNNPYDFKLLFCTKRDGFDAQIFHELCDDKGSTLTLVKIVDIGIFGGYNELSWKPHELEKKDANCLVSDNNHLISDNNFLFYFNNKNDLNTSNISRVRNNCLVEKCYSLHGPCFGWNKKYKFSNNDSHDIYIDSNWLHICQRFIHYSHPNFSKFEKLQSKCKYEIEDYEVWQIIKKDKPSQ